MGLTRKTIEYLNTAIGGSFMHVSIKQGRNISTKILQDLSKEREKLLEEESHLAEPESLPEPSLTSAIPDPEPPEKEETLISDFMLEFEDELFDEYGNTSNYYVTRKPLEPRKPSSVECNTPGVMVAKTGHVIICIAKHPGFLSK
jgi:hypothetical protein